ncbi:lysylphosphatidylglycerol synthase transmembrane domain-containing protein [Actinosynnema sp. NPDC020468]|uniref:lysylphosphatidylglycerol synthase transmembrane domain-containing protein n=1 Tax=Actinosynnema sp. NPDC020468 TaxID=3154488 RepID=UPI0033DFD7BB
MTRLLAGLVSLALAAWLVIAVVPAVGGVSWSAVGDVLAGVTWPTLVGLLVLWLAGQWCYSYVLSGSMPGLRPGQAFLITAAGSAVSNLLPFGGAAGVAVTAVMATSWGHSPRAITTSTLVSGIWNTAFRVALPLVALAVQGAAVLGNGALAVIVVGVVTTLALLLPLAGPRWAGRLFGARVLRLLLHLRLSTRQVIRERWPELTGGMIAYLALQGLLFWCCLATSGAVLDLPTTVAAFAVSRLLTLAIVTPGGVGITENATIALLVALATPAAHAVAGVLLFSTFTYAAEIPLGALAYLAWSARNGKPPARANADRRFRFRTR